MARQADPYREPITPSSGSALKTLVLLALLGAGGYVGYFYYQNGRLPFVGSFKAPAAAPKKTDAVANIEKDVTGPAKPMSREALHPRPIDMTTQAKGSFTEVHVTLKPEAISKYQKTYVKVQVVIPQFGFDATSPRERWPEIGRKTVAGAWPLKLEQVAVTVFGVAPDGKKTQLYAHAK